MKQNELNRLRNCPAPGVETVRIYGGMGGEGVIWAHGNDPDLVVACVAGNHPWRCHRFKNSILDFFLVKQFARNINIDRRGQKRC